jgi:hypothetical protein
MHTLTSTFFLPITFTTSPMNEPGSCRAYNSSRSLRTAHDHKRTSRWSSEESETPMGGQIADVRSQRERERVVTFQVQIVALRLETAQVLLFVL